MKIEVSEKALQWFKDEVGLEQGDSVRFFTQIYGSSPIQEGYALAFTIENDLSDASVQVESDGITFFVNETDLWFFKDYNLYVEYDEKLDEVEYQYKKD
ncbi:uncharacterized protein YneR [Gracilibacillus halotolerans]|uniref:Uncharacterized protein YneR n=1 Tax=Gracilibacillus halotolerans TaxID=74386 RepID=A0A841RQ01_9BACI|nr:HesB/YadR/YfhF family protein [Gracilibacillus halotolerans]MBB6513004.1 uncharacterized protein YneR [Gracilibacillus halotolerans]